MSTRMPPRPARPRSQTTKTRPRLFNVEVEILPRFDSVMLPRLTGRIRATLLPRLVLSPCEDAEALSVSHSPVPDPLCNTCEDTGRVEVEVQIGAPGSGGMLTCPDCGPTPSEAVSDV